MSLDDMRRELREGFEELKRENFSPSGRCSALTYPEYRILENAVMINSLLGLLPSASIKREEWARIIDKIPPSKEGYRYLEAVRAYMSDVMGKDVYPFPERAKTEAKKILKTLSRKGLLRPQKIGFDFHDFRWVPTLEGLNCVKAPPPVKRCFEERKGIKRRSPYITLPHPSFDEHAWTGRGWRRKKTPPSQIMREIERARLFFQNVKTCWSEYESEPG